MAKYIHQISGWPDYEYDLRALLPLLTQVLERKSELFGTLRTLGFDELLGAKLDAITTEVVKSSEIEGELFNLEVVRSSVARRLGMETGGIPSGNHELEGIVEVAVDATEHCFNALNEERLFNWHAALFPSGRGTFGRLRVGQWRDDALGPMQVVSKPMTANEVVHFEAPAASLVPEEIRQFVNWFEADTELSDVLKAGIAHLWFVTIHPFEDGNGRIGRAIMDMALARADKHTYRCYSVSSQIRAERQAYYDALSKAQCGTLDYTEWLEWFLRCLARSIDNASRRIDGAISRAKFWQRHSNAPLNDRQRRGVSRMLVGWEGNMTNKKWKTLVSCSDSTATRDLDELVNWGIFDKEGEGRGVRYRLLMEAPTL